MVSAPSPKPKRRAPKAARIEGLLDDVDEVVEPPAPPKRKPRVDVPAVVIPEVVIPEVVVPEVVVPEVVEPEVVPEVVPEPEVIEAVPAVNWQRSTSAWTQRVFNTAPRIREAETVAWPPRWKPADELIDLTDDSEADQMDASR